MGGTVVLLMAANIDQMPLGNSASVIKDPLKYPGRCLQTFL